MWNGGSAAGLVFLVWKRCALDVQSSDAQRVYLDMTCQQRAWRPPQGDVLCEQPHAIVVAELQPVQIQRCRERAMDAGDFDVAFGELGGYAYDERAPAFSVADDEHRADQQHDQRYQHGRTPGGDFHSTMHRKACPRPM